MGGVLVSRSLTLIRWFTSWPQKKGLPHIHFFTSAVFLPANRRNCRINFKRNFLKYIPIFKCYSWQPNCQNINSHLHFDNSSVNMNASMLYYVSLMYPNVYSFAPSRTYLSRWQMNRRGGKKSFRKHFFFKFWSVQNERNFVCNLISYKNR